MGILASLPLIGPGDISAGRVFMAMALGSVAAAWVISARPRRKTSRIECQPNALTLGGQHHEALAIALGGVREDSANSALCFHADVVTPSTRVRILEGMDPGLVMAQAEELARLLSVPLRPGWGLDEGALSAPSDDRRRAEPKTVHVIGELRPSQRATGFTALGSALFVLIFTAVLISRRGERGENFDLLSLVLGGLITAFGLGVAAWILGVRTELSLSSEGLDCRRSWLSRTLKRERVQLGELRGLFAVSPDGTHPTHVLTRVEGGWRSFPMAGEPARELAAGFLSISRQAERPTQRPERAESPEFSGARTASG